MAHPKTKDLIQYAERRVSENYRLVLIQHFEACAFCAREVRNFEEVLDGLKGADLQHAPESVLRKCVAVYQIPEPKAKLTEIFANLIFDSIAQPLTAGVRGASESRQIVLRCAGVDAHLRISTNPPVILGQLIERTNHCFISGARVGLIHKGKQLEATITDRLGEFRFGVAPQGDIRLQADLPSAQRLIADFTVSEKEGF
jgi:hypothetical protein